MAAYDDSLFISEGQSWSLWAENIGFRSPNSDHEDEEAKSNQDKTSTCLNREEMAIYGYCPRWEDFYLVVCNLCGKAIKPQALRQHRDLRHKEECNSIKNEAEIDCKSSHKSSILKKEKSNPFKYESKLDVQEPFREGSVSPLDSLTNANEFNVEESVKYKSVLNRECNTTPLGNSNSLSRSSRSISTQRCDILSVTDDISSLPVLKINLKSEPLEDSFLSSHLSPSCSLPPHLPPPVPPEPQHVPPPPSPHVGPPPSIGPPTPGLGSNIGPPTPGRGPPTPLMGPSTPGVGPPTPGMGPPTPGITTPNMKPPTPAMSPLAPVIGPPSTSGVGPLTPGMVSQVSSLSQQTLSHGQTTNICPLTQTYVSQAQVQNLGPHTPNVGQNQGVSPLTPTHIPQSPSLDHAVPGMGTQMQRMGPLTPGISQQLQMIGSQTVRIDTPSPNLCPNTPPLTSNNLSAVTITCGQGQSLSHLSQEVRGTGRSVSILKHSSAEEEVNRISAMLMKEAEEISCQGNNLRENGSSSLHAGVDIVEAQGLAAGVMRQGTTLPNRLSVGSVTPSTSTKVPLTTSTNLNQVNSQAVSVSQTSGSVPVPMSSMSMATLKQIQDDLLATVSESDLNAVLNATPDTPVLPNNSHCYVGGNNIQYSDRGIGTSESFVEPSHMNSQGALHYSSSDILPMPVIEQLQLTSEMLADSERPRSVYSSSTPILQDQLTNSHDQLGVSGQALQYNDNDKNSHCDELTQAVDSITKLCQEGNNNSLESQLSLVGLLQQPTLTSASSLRSNSGSSINLNSLSTPSSQGITVVIGGSHDNSSTPVSLTSLAGTLKKTSIVSTINSNFLSHLTAGNSGTASGQGIVPVELPCQDPVQTNQDPYVCQAQQTIVSQAPKVPTTVTIPQQTSLQVQSQIHHQQTQPQYTAQASTQSQQTQYITNQTFSQQQPSNQVHAVSQQQQPQQQQQQQPQQPQQPQQQQQQQQQQLPYPSTPTPVPPLTPSPKKSNKKKKPGERKLLPLKDREYDAEIHCGVLIMDTGKPCTRSLTCKTHPLSLRRAVHGRSKKFDELLNEHKAAKEAQMKASKPSEAAAGMVQSTPPRGPVGMSNASSNGQLNGHSAHVASNVGTCSTSSSLLVRTLGGLPTTPGSIPHPDPSPTSMSSHFHSADPPTTPHSQTTTTTTTTTPPSPAYWPSQHFALPLCHSDNFFVQESPKPVAICSYNTRRLGGYLATDHKVDTLRSALASALKKPQSGSSTSEAAITNNLLFNNNIERYNNIKPLLARKLQATIPSSSTGNKEGIGVGVGYNGHIQLNSGSGVALHNSALAASLKRPTHQEVIRHNSAVISARSKTKKVKPNDSAINYVSNVVQLDASGNKNHIPVVVSLPNGLPNPQTITLGNVPIASVRNSSSHPLRLHPPITVRDAQVTETRTTVGDGTNIVLGSGIPSGGFVIADALKPIKNESSGSIRLDGSKLISSKGGISGGSSSGGTISLVGSPSSLSGSTTTVTTPAVPHQGQVYFTTVSGSNNNQLLQQLLNCRPLGKNTGMKLLGPSSNPVTGNRQTFVLQPEREPS